MDEGRVAEPARDRHDRRHGGRDDAGAGYVLLRGRLGVQPDRPRTAFARLVRVRNRTEMSRWYIIHAYSGFENKVRDQIVADATRLGLEQLVEAVEVPTEKITEVRRGKKV